jgi:large subunit ribosomal protein L2
MKSLIHYKKSYKFPKSLSKFSNFFKLEKFTKQKAGRNNQGKICVWHKGGGHKKLYRPLDFSNKNIEGRLLSIEYDPYRSAFIGLFLNIKNHNLYYGLVSENQTVGSTFKISKSSDDIIAGNKMKLKYIPLGTLISGLELKKNKGIQLLRSAGAFGKLQRKDLELNLGFIKMPSGKIVSVNLECIAMIGVISNVKHNMKNISKAGRNRWLNKRPTVRGVAMNPVDHPHGGGEGKTSGGRHPVTPWGRLTKGFKTVRRNKKLKQF